MITLFISATGDDWHNIMNDVSEANLQEWYITKVYFLFFITSVQFVMMNLFILVLVQQFEENYSNPDNLIETFSHHLTTFQTIWANYT